VTELGSRDYQKNVKNEITAKQLKGLQFFFVELSKSTIKQHFSFVCNVKEDGHRELPVPAIMVCAGLSAAVASTAIYPVDVARRRMQLGQFRHSIVGM